MHVPGEGRREEDEKLDLVLGELVKIINDSEDEIHFTGRDTLYNATIRWKWIRTIDKRIERCGIIAWGFQPRTDPTITMFKDVWLC